MLKAFCYHEKPKNCSLKAMLQTTQNLKLSHNKKFDIFFHVKVSVVVVCVCTAKSTVEALLIGEHGNFAENLHKSGTQKLITLIKTCSCTLEH